MRNIFYVLVCTALKSNLYTKDEQVHLLEHFINLNEAVSKRFGKQWEDEVKDTPRQKVYCWRNFILPFNVNTERMSSQSRFYSSLGPCTLFPFIYVKKSNTFSVPNFIFHRTFLPIFLVNPDLPEPSTLRYQNAEFPWIYLCNLFTDWFATWPPFN